jgi:hypothetical protein
MDTLTNRSLSSGVWMVSLGEEPVGVHWTLWAPLDTTARPRTPTPDTCLWILRSRPAQPGCAVFAFPPRSGFPAPAAGAGLPRREDVGCRRSRRVLAGRAPATRLGLDTGDTMALPGRGSSMPMPGMIVVFRPCQGSPVWGAIGCGECCGVPARTEAWLPAPCVLALAPLVHQLPSSSTAGRCAAARPLPPGETTALHPRGIRYIFWGGGFQGACPPDQWPPRVAGGRTGGQAVCWPACDRAFYERGNVRLAVQHTTAARALHMASGVPDHRFRTTLATRPRGGCKRGGLAGAWPLPVEPRSGEMPLVAAFFAAMPWGVTGGSPPWRARAPVRRGNPTPGGLSAVGEAAQRRGQSPAARRNWRAPLPPPPLGLPADCPADDAVAGATVPCTGVWRAAQRRSRLRASCDLSADVIFSCRCVRSSAPSGRWCTVTCLVRSCPTSGTRTVGPSPTLSVLLLRLRSVDRDRVDCSDRPARSALLVRETKRPYAARLVAIHRFSLCHWLWHLNRTPPPVVVPEISAVPSGDLGWDGCSCYAALDAPPLPWVGRRRRKRRRRRRRRRREFEAELHWLPWPPAGDGGVGRLTAAPHPPGFDLPARPLCPPLRHHLPRFFHRLCRCEPEYIQFSHR